jgi:hypothetical protein
MLISNKEITANYSVIKKELKYHLFSTTKALEKNQQPFSELLLSACCIDFVPPKPNLLHIKPIGPVLPLLVFPILSISSLIPLHSFSSSETRNLISSTVSLVPPFSSVVASPLVLLGRMREPFWSTLSETKNQPAIVVLRRSCSKNRTCTMTLRGNLSFCAACVHASRESF